MDRTQRIFRTLRFSGAFATFAVGAVLLAFSAGAVAQFEDYSDPSTCGSVGCHDAQYNDWKVSGHPYKLMRGEQAQNRPIPLPEGYTWDDISWVIGGYKWKSRYMDQDGYILTQDGSDDGGNTQYNNLTGVWSDYNADMDNGTKPYDCGSCHTTGWIANPDPTDLAGNKDMLPGIHGDFFAGGVQCQQCHGTDHPGNKPDMDEPGGCGDCHIRGDADTIPASGGFIRHHEQYNEHLAGPHASFDCSSCHNPHKRGEWSIVTECADCHSGLAGDYAETSMSDYGVTCEDCHMPFATKSAKALGPEIDGNQTHGDVMTHIFYIDTDPAGDMFTDDGGFVDLDSAGKAMVTMNFACQRCHETAALEELGKFAKDFHDTDKTLADVGLNPGLTGTWWNAARSGEGFVLEFAYDPAGNLFLFATFYTYDDMGNQVYLIGQSTSMSGTTANVDVYITSGRMYGDAFDPADGATVLWGTGTFEFPTCGTASMSLMPNADAQASGFTNLAYDLTRDLLESGVSCPTFVNNAQ